MSFPNLSNHSIQQLMRWFILTLLFPLVFLNGWLLAKVFNYFEPLVTVLIIAMLLALILHYPVRFLCQQGMARGQAVATILLATLVVALGLGITLMPVLLEDVNEMAQQLPDWVESGTQQLHTFQDWLARRGVPVSIGRLIQQVAIALPNELQAIADHAATLVLETVGSLSQGLLVLVLTFYFVADGERLMQEVFGRVSTPWGTKIRHSLQENFQRFFLGQATLASLVGLSMTLIFTLLQIPYSLLFGLGVGIMALIPFGDIVTCTLISILLGFQDFWLGVKILAISIIADQIIDQLIAPRLLGKFTGLRPVWVLLSLLIGAKVGGLLGLVVAVPLASVTRSALNGFAEADGADETGDAASTALSDPVAPL